MFSLLGKQFFSVVPACRNFWRVAGVKVGLPIPVDEMELIVERVLFALTRDDLAVYLGKVPIQFFFQINKFFIVVGFNSSNVSALQEIGKQLHELLLFLRCALAPVTSERSSCHLGKVKSRIYRLP